MLLKPLIANHGLGTLLSVVQLELAKDAAIEAKVTVTPKDIADERELTLGKLFRQNDDRLDDLIEKAERIKNTALAERYRKEKETDRDALLRQFFEKERINPGELDLVLETNAYLRKVAEPRVRGLITDELLKKEYELQYNEKVLARHIALDNPRDYWVARQRLEKGEPFDVVARELSKNPQTASVGGDLPPISRTDERFPQNFRDAVFAMKKPYELSDMIASGANTWHLVQYIKRVAPRDMPFEKVKDSLREQLLERAITSVMGKLRDNIAAYVRESLRINEPTIAEQFKSRLDTYVKNEAEERARLEMEAARLRDKAATQPAAIAMPEISPDPTVEEKAPQSGPTSGPAPSFGPAAEPASKPAAPPAAATRPADGAATRPAGYPN